MSFTDPPPALYSQISCQRGMLMVVSVKRTQICFGTIPSQQGTQIISLPMITCLRLCFCWQFHPLKIGTITSFLFTAVANLNAQRSGSTGLQLAAPDCHCYSKTGLCGSNPSMKNISLFFLGCRNSRSMSAIAESYSDSAISTGTCTTGTDDNESLRWNIDDDSGRWLYA